MFVEVLQCLGDELSRRGCPPASGHLDDEGQRGGEAVSCLALGPRSGDQLAQCLDWFAHPVPPALWDDVAMVLAAAGRAV